MEGRDEFATQSTQGKYIFVAIKTAAGGSEGASYVACFRQDADCQKESFVVSEGKRFERSKDPVLKDGFHLLGHGWTIADAIMCGTPLHDLCTPPTTRSKSPSSGPKAR